MDVDTGEIMALREEVSQGRKRSAYFYFVLVLTVVFGAGTSALVSVKLNQRSERKLCAVVISADDQFREKPPPAGTATAAQAANFSELRMRLGCPPFTESESK